MDAEIPQPELFVARDRARRFTRYVRDALQERRLNYRGADVGMTALVDEAEEALSAVVEDARRTVADILDRRIRDRERGYMELPLVTLSEGLIDRVDLARRMDRALTAGGVPLKEARSAVISLLDDVVLRLDAYVGAYDEKRPVGPRRAADLAHLLIAVERHAAWERMLSDASTATGAPYDKPPPTLQSDPNGLEDLLRAARAAVGGVPGPWHVELAGPGRPLTLSLGARRAGDVAVPAPERLARAAEVLAFLHPVAVECLGVLPATDTGLLSADPEAPAPDVHEVRLRLADEAAGSLELTVAAAAGPAAALDADAERAVRALLESPPLPDAGPPPPERLIALLGLMRALDTALVGRVLGNVRKQACRVAASRLPREDTRKAPLQRAMMAALEAEFAAFPAHRAEEVAVAAAEGKLAARHVAPAQAAVLLALFGRSWQVSGRRLDRSIALEPLSDADVAALVNDLGEIAATRRDLEAGRAVDGARITRLEQGSIAVLGRLGRVASSLSP